MKWAFILIVVFLSSCGVFRNTTRQKKLDKVSASLLLDVARVDTSKRLVLERWTTDQLFPGRTYSFGGSVINRQLIIKNGLFDLHVGLDSLGKVLTGTFTLPPNSVSGQGERLTLEQKGVSERDNSELDLKEKHTGDDRTGTASWKGVWVWLGGIALGLIFLFLLIKK